MTTNLTSKAALEMDADDAADTLDNLQYFLGELADRIDYFKSKGHPNPGDQVYKMILSMMIMMLDKLELEGLFKPNGWRPVFDYWEEHRQFPDDFMDAV